jgi:hypothetical protein
MVGYIYVSNSRFHASTDFNGESSLAVPTPITEISVWHPGLSIDSQKELLLSLKSLQQIDGVYQINLLMGQPATNPQAMQAPNRDRFKRFMKPKE